MLTMIVLESKNEFDKLKSSQIRTATLVAYQIAGDEYEVVKNRVTGDIGNMNSDALFSLMVRAGYTVDSFIQKVA